MSIAVLVPEERIRQAQREARVDIFSASPWPSGPIRLEGEERFERLDRDVNAFLSSRPTTSDLPLLVEAHREGVAALLMLHPKSILTNAANGTYSQEIFDQGLASNDNDTFRLHHRVIVPCTDGLCVAIDHSAESVDGALQINADAHVISPASQAATGISSAFARRGMWCSTS